VPRLLDRPRAAGAHKQAATLASRLPAVSLFRLFLEQNGLADQFRSEREATAPRPRHGAERKTWTYGLFPRPRDREATLPVGLPSARRIRKVSLDSSLSGRPELHCEAQLSAPAPRNLYSDRTRFRRV
jgi:hypothetical protein